ncbi:unnamed protein product [Penicillium camemberti]|uniref:Str. FM013 n=1 Tax=Penicillium camemberti (strain FM 013) TaxID=1429867 RepID=A0A0G4PM66_PENC3|nr:unnamed protein product [Penicillium camemberti]
MRKENGSEVIAKILCYIAGLPTLTTAGEVGALEYIRKHISIPVPRVISWSSSNSNAVGAEYIIMEKAAGPVFLNPPQNYDYEKGIFEVKLRDNFDTLDEDSKILAMREWS